MSRTVLVQLVAGALLFAVPSASAHAAERPIRVALPGGSVLVDRSPLRIRVLRNGNDTLLTSVQGDRRRGGTRYAALTFTTGSESELRIPRLPNTPNPNPAHPAAAQRFAATAVSAIRRRNPSDVLLTLKTDDPRHRRIELRIKAEPHFAVSLEARVVGGPAVAMAAAFASPRGEAFHGFGGRRESTDLRGQAFTSWVFDYRFPDVSQTYYLASPQFESSRGYGVLLDDTRIARWRMASDTDAWRVAVGGSSMRLLVATGSPADIIGAITTLTGRHRPAPAWSLQPTLSRTIQINQTPVSYERQVLDDVARLERERPPVGAYAIEGWAQMPRAEIVDVIARLKAIGVHTILYLRSFVSADRAGTEGPGVYDDALARGVIAKQADGSPYLFDSSFPPPTPAAVIDYTNPATQQWWNARVAELLDTGADGFMNDFGEQVLPGMRFADGSAGDAEHNLYPALQARATRDAVDAYALGHPGREPFFFQRAGWGGRDGSAGAENATFPGDESADWSRSTGLPSIVPDMLNRAVGGAYGFSTDIGGYADFRFVSGKGFTPVSAELFTRWAQASVFMTHFRVHNSALTGVKMPWAFDSQTRRRWDAAARLHQRALPLIERLWGVASKTGMPVTRPLWLAMPSAASSARADDEWLLGDDLLAAPVLRAGARSRPVLLPPGCWQRGGAGARLAGRRTVTARASLDDLPWYVRCGRQPLG